MTTGFEILSALKAGGVDFVVSVPCKLLAELIRELEKDRTLLYTPVTREEEGVGLCAGAYLGGRLPCMVMQNSGLGNTVNAMASLVTLYRLPMVLIISFRGTPGEAISAQVPMARLTRPLLDLLGFATFHFHHREALRELPAIVRHARIAESPVAVLMDYHFFGDRT